MINSTQNLYKRIQSTVRSSKKDGTYIGFYYKPSGEKYHSELRVFLAKTGLGQPNCHKNSQLGFRRSLALPGHVEDPSPVRLNYFSLKVSIIKSIFTI